MKRKYIQFIILNLVYIVHEVKLIHFVVDHNDFVMFYLNFLNLLFVLIENKEIKIRRKKKNDYEEIYHVQIVLIDHLNHVVKVFEMFVNDLIILLVVFEDSKLVFQYKIIILIN